MLPVSYTHLDVYKRQLLSNVNLYTEKNALVLFSADRSLYPIINTSFEGLQTRRSQSPISARHAENIAITGHGAFDGNEDTWRPTKKDKLTEGQWKKLIASGGVVDAEDVYKRQHWYRPTSNLTCKSIPTATMESVEATQLNIY